MNKRIIYFILIIVFASVTTLSCTSKSDDEVDKKVSDNKATENITDEKNSSNENVNLNTNYSDIRRIVFNESIDDSQAEYLNTFGGAEVLGVASIDLTLYESEPGVFEGYGTISRTLEMPDEDMNLKQEYIYRTGLIHAEDGIETIMNPICSFTELKKESFYIGEDVPYDYINQKDGTMQQDLPIILNIEGEEAKLSVIFHEQATLVFEGEITNNQEQTHKEVSESEGLIYINSMWSESFLGGYGDYNAILLASPSSKHDKSYSGKISVNGSSDDLNEINEEVTFTVEKFSDELYTGAGGKLKDKFEYMGVFNAAGDDFILLYDEEQIILEPVGKDKYFCGGMHSIDDFSILKNEADKTIEMASYLYRVKNSELENYLDLKSFEGLDPNKPEDMQKLMDLAEELTNKVGSENVSPSWYPHELIPKVNFSEYDGFTTTPLINEQFFKLYVTDYAEDENLEDLILPYKEVLSKYDNYMEYIDYEKGEAEFLFTMGRYFLRVYMVQSSLKITSVGVQIY